MSPGGGIERYAALRCLVAVIGTTLDASPSGASNVFVTTISAPFSTALRTTVAAVSASFSAALTCM
eukprot:5954301-Prymnesium_polylepis.1